MSKGQERLDERGAKKKRQTAGGEQEEKKMKRARGDGETDLLPLGFPPGYAQNLPDYTTDDIIGSPYAVVNYTYNPQLGSDGGISMPLSFPLSLSLFSLFHSSFSSSYFFLLDFLFISFS